MPINCMCQLCGVTVIGRLQAELHGMDPESEKGKIADYDALAAIMWKHISDFHPDQMGEGIMQQRRAAKMYAMNWATIAPELEPIRVHHRQQLLMSMTITTKFEDRPLSKLSRSELVEAARTILNNIDAATEEARPELTARYNAIMDEINTRYAGAPAPSPSESSASPGEGSNEKKSLRNASN